ncbi:MAG TPA: hypothetical protein VKF39_04435 [Nitrososphaerales archaeon]|nr:hypothetical protein [Nitrososphaerales archaeon]
MNSETLTNVFWGLFLVWFGAVAFVNKGDFVTLVNGSSYSALLGLGTGLLLLAMNLVRNSLRMKVGSLTLGLGVILAVFYAPQVFLGISAPLLPTLLIILGVALVIGALRSRDFRAD